MTEETKVIPVAAEPQQPTTTPDIIPAQPGERQPEQRIDELDRALLSEAWHEAVATRNAMVALQADHRRLQAETKTIEAESQIQELLGQQLQQRLQQRLQEVREKYNIPDGYQVDAKTGLVTEPPPPDEAAPQATQQPAPQ